MKALRLDIVILFMRLGFCRLPPLICLNFCSLVRGLAKSDELELRRSFVKSEEVISFELAPHKKEPADWMAEPLAYSFSPNCWP